MKSNTQTYQLNEDDLKHLEDEVMANKSNLILSVDMNKFVGIDKRNMQIGLEPIDDENDENALF